MCNNTHMLRATIRVLAIAFSLSGVGVVPAVDELVVISPHNDAIRHEFGRGFAEWMKLHHSQEVRVQWRDVGGSSEALRFVQSEFEKKPQGIGVDCFFGGGLEPHLVLSKKKLLKL